MAIKRPDIYEHNNPNLAIVDSDFVRGGGRVVANLTELYALANKIDQLKERVTKVYVISKDITYVLVNKLDITEGIFNSTAWEEESGGMSTVYTDGTTITGNGSEESPLVAQIPEETDPIYSLDKDRLSNTSGTNTGDQDLSGLVEKIDNHSLVLDTEIAKLATIEEYAEPNDPNTVIDANYVHTDNNYTDMDKTLLSTALQSESDPVYALDKDRLANTSGVNTGDQDLSELVPYTGATKNVDLGDFNLKANGLEVDIVTPLVIERPGQIGWNAIDGTLNFGLLNGTTLQVGQELHFFGKASSLITNGDVVQFAGVQGDHFLIKKAVPSEINLHPEYLLGVATNTIINNEFGYVTCFGKINEISTSTWTLVQPILYFDFNNGGMTQVVPSAPTRRITIASVIKLSTGEANNGIIFVRPSWGFKITDLDDVNGTPLTTSGQIMIWNNDLGVFDFTGNINDFMKESDYVGETGTKQVKYAVSSQTAGQASRALADILGRTIHETYALKQSGVTPPETARVILDNTSPQYIISEITAENLIVENNATVGGEVIAPTLATDKVLKITIQGNDTMLNGNTYEDGVTIFAIYEAATETWTFSSILDPEVPDYSDMTVDVMLDNPTVITSMGNGIVVAQFIHLNKTVFIRTHATAIGIYQCVALYSGNAYLQLIAAGTALHTVRVKDGDVWYSQYDGNNAWTLLFERITVEKLAITKQGFNGELSPVVYPVDRQRTVIGYKLGSNATDFSVTINSVNYTKADVTNVVVPVNTEIKINDVTIAVGKDTGNVVLILK